MKSKLKVCISLLLITSLVNGQNFDDYGNMSTPGWETYYHNYFWPYPSWGMFDANSSATTNTTVPYLDIQWTTSNVADVTIRILNAKGKTVRTLMADNVSTQRIYLDGLPGGTYMVMLVNDSDQQVVRFVIK
jgi:Secretion system C-terminal sorting domain